MATILFIDFNKFVTLRYNLIYNKISKLEFTFFYSGILEMSTSSYTLYS